MFWRFKNTLLNNSLSKKELYRKIKFKLRINNGNTIFQSLWDVSNLIIQGNYFLGYNYLS